MAFAANILKSRVANGRVGHPSNQKESVVRRFIASKVQETGLTEDEPTFPIGLRNPSVAIVVIRVDDHLDP